MYRHRFKTLSDINNIINNKRKKVFFRLALLRCSLTWRAKSKVKVKEIVIICALQCIEIDYDKLQLVCLIGGRVCNPRQQHALNIYL